MRDEIGQDVIGRRVASVGFVRSLDFGGSRGPRSWGLSRGVELVSGEICGSWRVNAPARGQWAGSKCRSSAGHEVTRSRNLAEVMESIRVRNGAGRNQFGFERSKERPSELCRTT